MSLQREMKDMTTEALRDAIVAMASEGLVVIVREPHSTPKRMWLTSEQVEEEYGIPAGTLRNWRSAKIGPRYSKTGREVRYARADMDAFMMSNLVLTSDQGGPK
jgi:hypothetical protein